MRQVRLQVRIRQVITCRITDPSRTNLILQGRQEITLKVA